MKTVHRTIDTDKPLKMSLGMTLGLAALALAPLAAGVGLLTIRHYSMRNMEAARSWVETPCEMEKCGWLSHDDGRSLDFVYQYEFDGREYRGDQLDPIIGSMGNDDVFEEFVYETYPVGARATCFVNPDVPSESVFDRDHGTDAPRRMWLLAFPFVCAGLGFGLVLIAAIVGSRRSVTSKPKPESLALTTAPGPPPRHIPWRTRMVVLAGPVSSQVAWPIAVAFVFVFILLDGPTNFVRLLDFWPNELSVTGRITNVQALDEREMYATIHQYSVVYEIDGTEYTNDSFTRGKKYDEGDEVTVRYEPAAPDKGTIAGARSSNFPWWVSAIPLGVLMLLGIGMIGMYVHSIRAIRLLRFGEVRRTTWRGPMVGAAGAGGHDDEDEIPSMISEFEFEVGGRFYTAKKYSAQKKFKRRANRESPDPADALIVLYNPRNPSRNVILSGALAEMLNRCRSTWDHVMHCFVAPLSIAVLYVLFRGAELI